MRSLLITASLLLYAVGCRPAASETPAKPAPDSGARWSYEIRVDDALEVMQLGLCIEGQVPQRLIAGREAIEFVSAARVRGGPALARDDRSFELEGLGAHGCVDLEIDLEQAIASGGRDAGRHGDAIMLAPDRWLWYPSAVPDGLDARARFELPEGVAATVPWPNIDPSNDHPTGWRRLDRTSFGWNAWITFGHYEPLRFTAAECEFEVAVLDGDHEFSNAGVEDWLRIAAETSAELYGRFPRDRVAVVVIPTASRGDEPVAFGMARRGGGGSVMLIIDEAARDHELPGEWVAIHELLHLGMPLVKEPWMSEGFVTYYTQVLRARRGVLKSEDQARAALEMLLAGFDRRPTLRTLESASETMRQLGGYRRVYWGGAAAAFDLDVQLRSASQNRRSLDDLMRLAWPLAPEHRQFTAAELLERFDEALARWFAAGELSRELSASSIIARHLRSKSIPADVAQLRGLAVDASSSALRLLADPIDEVRVRTELFGSDRDAGSGREISP